METPIEGIEAHFGITLPAKHRAALANPADPLMKNMTLLVPNGNDVTDIYKVNEGMRTLEFKRWPPWLVAFATEGGGDYFAYDTRKQPYLIYYIDPNESVPESIQGNEEEGYVFFTFDDWYKHALEEPDEDHPPEGL